MGRSVFLVAMILSFFCMPVYAQSKLADKQLRITKSTTPIKIDGVLNEESWKVAAKAMNFVQFQPTPFLPEAKGNETEAYLSYNNEGIYIGGFLHENNKDSIAAELTGRDGFGNNDFIGITLDTYQDKLNGFEYFITPLNEQWDAKVSNGGKEDFSWNAVWQSAVKMRNDGWTFEMFIPYSAIRFGKKKLQDWNCNIVRQRRKSGQKSFWSALDPNMNGFLTQSGTLQGFEEIKPPVRLQLSPYFSTYYTYDGYEKIKSKKSDISVNGGMDVKYGLNQAFTLDMTLIPDFGQVQSDNITLNLSPFEQRYSENRPFFTEGTELFNKGNLFYSRRIGGQPLHYGVKINPNETVIENPSQSKLVNATKISGRTQSGLGIGVLNAITNPQYAIIENVAKERRKIETDPLTNYNVFVLDKTLKNNSSISFVNTSVLRSGHDYDADVAAALWDINDKSNTWNTGGKISVSNIISADKSTTGYSHFLYFGKTSGRFNFRFSQDLTDSKYNKNDLGYFTNNNSLGNSLNASYSWNEPRKWYNRKNIHGNIFYGRLVSPIDFLKRKQNMFAKLDFSMDASAQSKKLWYYELHMHIGTEYNDYYESRDFGRIFHNKGSKGINFEVRTNNAKKISGTFGLFTGTGGVFKRTSFDPSASVKYRFSSKFSVESQVNVSHQKNQVGFADLKKDKLPGHTLATDTILFSRRNVDGVENVFVIKYNINNKMGFNLRARHSYTKVAPVQLYQLDVNGDLHAPDRVFENKYNQNFNYLSADMAYNWQFNPGSFLTIAWKDIGNSFSKSFEKNYASNLGNIITGKQFTSFSVKVIYFLDYVGFRNKMKEKKGV